MNFVQPSFAPCVLIIPHNPCGGHSVTVYHILDVMFSSVVGGYRAF